MEKPDFGFKIHKNRQIDFDVADRTLFLKISFIEPSLNRCIFCGGCSSTCSAGLFTEMSFRLVSLSIRRGMTELAMQHVKSCMLCGKCTMICPRDVNIRHIIVLLKKEFAQNEL